MVKKKVKATKQILDDGLRVAGFIEAADKIYELAKQGKYNGIRKGFYKTLDLLLEEASVEGSEQYNTAVTFYKTAVKLQEAGVIKEFDFAKYEVLELKEDGEIITQKVCRDDTGKFEKKNEDGTCPEPLDTPLEYETPEIENIVDESIEIPENVGTEISEEVDTIYAVNMRDSKTFAKDVVEAIRSAGLYFADTDVEHIKYMTDLLEELGPVYEELRVLSGFSEEEHNGTTHKFSGTDPVVDAKKAASLVKLGFIGYANSSVEDANIYTDEVIKELKPVFEEMEQGTMEEGFEKRNIVIFRKSPKVAEEQEAKEEMDAAMKKAKEDLENEKRAE